jgi:iron complex outermembrane recepter protein
MTSRMQDILAALLALAAFSASAQSSGADQSAPDSSGMLSNTLAEVVVTAEKRESTVQKTPFSVTAITGDQLLEQGVASIRGVAGETPGISLRSSGPGQTEYEMRGLPSSGGSSATVGFYLNETPLAAAAGSLNGKVAIDPDLYDVSRIEVLRGPQGTLYGAGSMGGTIKIVTAAPNLEAFDVSGQLLSSHTSGGGLNWGASGMLNLPLVQDRLALRLVATDDYTDGWIDRVVVSPFPIGTGGSCGLGSCVRGNVQNAPVVKTIPRSNWERLNGGRGELKFLVTDALSVDVLAMYQKIRMGGPSQVDIPPGLEFESHYQPLDIAEPYADAFRIFSATISYDLGAAKLTSATSNWSRDSEWIGDESEVFQSVLSGFYGFPNLVAASYSNDDHSQQTSEELRLSSNGDAPWQWVVGGYYSKFESTFTQYAANPAYAVLSVGGPSANPLGISYQANDPYHINQYSAFAESSYLFANNVKVTVGARWFKYDTDLDFEQSGIYTETGNASLFTGHVSSSDSGFNPKLNIAYIPSDNLTLYAQAAKGFRPGGVNLPVPVPPCASQAPLSYGPDSLWNYEIGEKGRFFGGRVTVNADYYYIVWNGVQQLLTPPCGFSYTNNTGKAVSYGPELEVAAQLAHDLVFTFGGAYTEAHIQSVPVGEQGQSLGAATPLVAGLPLENVPRYTANVALNYDHPISNNLRLTARANATRTGPFHDISYYFSEFPGYTIADLQLGVAATKMSAVLFVDNVTNRIAITTANTMQWAVPIPSLIRAAVTTPRTMGLRVNYKFGARAK